MSDDQSQREGMLTDDELFEVMQDAAAYGAPDDWERIGRAVERAVLARQAARIEELEAAVTAARNLLAVIHRDGGHHTDQVGFVQSCQDAEKVRNRLVVDLEVAAVNLARAELCIAELEARLANAESALHQIADYDPIVEGDVVSIARAALTSQEEA